MSERQERWDVVALVAALLLVVVLFVAWLQWNFGLATAAWVMGGLFVAVICAATARFTAGLMHRSQQNTADLLHEFGGAQASSYRVMEQQLRAHRDEIKLIGKAPAQLEARQGDAYAVQDRIDAYAVQDRIDAYAPVYVD